MKKLSFLACLLLLLFQQAIAQTNKVSGRVTSSGTGNPAEGISVVVKGKQSGTTTGTNGEFNILADKGSELVFSGIGFATKEVKVTGNSLDVTLQATSGDLGEVVVVGYGTQKKKDLTGSVIILKNEDLMKRQVPSTSQLLQGLAPGVTVSQQSGRPGADGANINIRGISSIYASSYPLIVIDGFPSALGIDDIDPNAIESITILKDASSTAIYGSRASNGVILLTTKKASKNKELQIAYNSYVSKQKATNIPQRANAVDFMTLSNVAEQNRTGNPAAFIYSQTLIDKYKNTAPNNLDVIDNDWVALLFTNRALLQNHNITINAGGENLSMFTSISYMDQQGLIPNSNYRKTDIRMNPEYKINSKLSINAQLNYNENRTVTPSTSSAEFIIKQAIGIIPIGGAKFGPDMYGNAGQSNNRNPLAQAEAAGTTTTIYRSLLSKIGFTYKPIKNILVEAFWARQFWIPNTKSVVKNVNIYQPNIGTGSYDFSGVWPGTNSVSESYSTNIRTSYSAQVSYNGRYKLHAVKVMAGTQTELTTYRGISAGRTNFTNQDLPFLSLGTQNQTSAGGANELALAGFFGRVNYAYNDKYLLELNGRYDGTSKFSQTQDKQWGFFPSASIGWIFTSEKFLSSISNILSFGKLRASIGSLGNQALGGNYPFVSTYDPNYNAYFNGTTTSGYAITTATNSAISWEKSNQTNFGLDLNFVNGLTVTAEYYIRDLNNMILLKPLPGFYTLSSPYVNAGSMRNKGWELTVNYRKKISKDVGINITAMVSDVKNEVTQLTDGVPYIDNGLARTQVGQAVNSYFGYRNLGYFQSAADISASPTHFFVPQPGDIKYDDLNGDSKVDANDRTFIGNSFPRYEYSLNLGVSYKNFDLSIFFQGVGKKNTYLTGTGAYPFYAADYIPGILEIHKDFWTSTNPNAAFPRLLPAIGVNGTNSSFWVKDASYLRLKNINLSYQIPSSLLNKVHIKSAKIFISGQNLLTFTNLFKGFDPEITTQDAQFYPLMKTFTGGVNINF